jgi:hypothetical protein
VTKRPPFLGYNHNVRHKGRLFHVQTEDSGLSRPVLTTHLFVEGTILATLRSQYLADEPDAVVQKRMQDQHKTMLKRVRDGEFDHNAEVLARPALSGAAPDAKGAAAAVPQSVAESPAQAIPRPAAAAPLPVAAAAPVTPLSQATTGRIAQVSSPGRKPGQPPPPPPPGRAAAGGPSTGSHATVSSSSRQAEITQELLVPRRSVEASPLAARLGLVAAPAAGPPVRPAPLVEQPKVIVALPDPTDDDDGEPMLELEPVAAAFLGDDDEPAVTIEAAEPTDEEAEAAELSKATPLPVAQPLIEDDTYIMGAEILVPPVRTGLFTVSVPSGSAARPGRPTQPLSGRLLHSGALRARPSSEGVVALCIGFGKVAGPVVRRLRGIMVVDPQRQSAMGRAASEPATLRSLPAPQAGRDFVASPPIDDALMAFLRRESVRSATR